MRTETEGRAGGSDGISPGGMEGAGAEGEVSLEARLRRLEEIVRLLEGDGVELERGLALFEEGVGHIRGAERTLSNAETRIQELIGSGEDDLRLRPFDPTE